ncbi:MAG: hypothetical protein R3C18_04860 [Planctomycetaceae bacterium]
MHFLVTQRCGHRRFAYVLALGTLLGMWVCCHANADDDAPAVDVVIPSPNAFGLADVKDNTRLGPEDNEPYFNLLQLARNARPEALRQAGKKFVSERFEKTHVPLFKDMLDNPGEFRGQPVFLRGHTLQVIEYEPLKNDFGIDKVYEASFFEEDAQGNLATIVFLEKPENLQLGTETVDGVSVSGYFLKMYYYDAEDSHTHKAPYILARTLHVATPAKPDASGFNVLGGIVFGVVALILLAVIFVQWREQQQRREQQKATIPQLDENIGVSEPFESGSGGAN